jgi:hypothetical protein
MKGTRLYYFLKAEHVLGNLTHRRLKISRIDTLNDPFEFLAADLSDPQLRWLLIEARNKHIDFGGIICFCDNWKTPVMWAHYGENYAGAALGFDVIAPAESLVKMQYVERRLPAPAKLYSANQRDEWQSFLNKMLGIKYDHWSYEGEHRLHVKLEHPDPVILDPLNRPMYFEDFKPHLELRQVIVGPMSTLTRADIKAALGALASSVDVFKCRPGYGEFAMVKDDARWK